MKEPIELTQAEIRHLEALGWWFDDGEWYKKINDADYAHRGDWEWFEDLRRYPRTMSNRLRPR